MSKNKSAPDYSQVLWAPNGNPYYAQPGGGQYWIAPDMALQGRPDPRLQAWARGKTGTTDPMQAAINRPHGGFWHSSGPWDGAKDKYESKFNWGNLMGLAIGGAIAAPVAGAALAGSAAPATAGTAGAAGSIGGEAGAMVGASTAAGAAGGAGMTLGSAMPWLVSGGQGVFSSISQSRNADKERKALELEAAIRESALNPYRAANAQMSSMRGLDQDMRTTPGGYDPNGGRYGSYRPASYTPSPELMAWMAEMQRRIASGQATNPQIAPQARQAPQRLY